MTKSTQELKQRAQEVAFSRYRVKYLLTYEDSVQERLISGDCEDTVEKVLNALYGEYLVDILGIEKHYKNENNETEPNLRKN